MQRFNCLVFLAAIVGLSGFGWSSEKTFTDKDRRHFVELVNEARKKEGLHELHLSTKLDESAQHWAEKIHEDNKLHHGGMDGVRGQCIARGQHTAEAAVKAWLGHPPHRRILLGKRYHEAGLGKAGSFWVADFK